MLQRYKKPMQKRGITSNNNSRFSIFVTKGFFSTFATCTCERRKNRTDSVSVVVVDMSRCR